MVPSKMVRHSPTTSADLDAIPGLVEGISPSTAASTCCSTSRATPSLGPLLDTTAENLRRTFNINVFATLVLTRES